MPNIGEVVFIILLIVCFVGIPTAIVIHEINETPLDKCLDSCVTERLVGELRLECNTMCVNKFASCVDSAQGVKDGK